MTIPAAASVYNEFALKKHMETSVHEQNFFLYFYGMMFNAAGLVIVTYLKGGTLAVRLHHWLKLVCCEERFDALFVGHNTITVLLIANNAIQGILSSFFFKVRRRRHHRHGLYGCTMCD